MGAIRPLRLILSDVIASVSSRHRAPNATASFGGAGRISALGDCALLFSARCARIVANTLKTCRRHQKYRRIRDSIRIQQVEKVAKWALCKKEE